VQRESTAGNAARDARILAGLRAADEVVFAEIVDRYHQRMIRLASAYVGSRSVAEEVVQDAWLGVLNGIDQFRGEASFQTWLFRIVTNIAKKRGVRERRQVPFSSVWDASGDDGDPSVPADRFLPSSDEWAGHWAADLRSWSGEPERRLLAGECQSLIEQVIETLPPAQREVITLRDVEGWDSSEVCDVLEVSEGNQRVLLHRARSKVRAALEEYLAP
jgi:RNA polymerase sigma-70 factor, ECF subfamily